ncbi:MAG: ribonuclease III, partial [Clostridia bacterium]|nr:ribonuclease III [Clostridia bacterium]
MLTGKSEMTATEAKQLSPVVLAFVGDAVYSLYVRERLVTSGDGKASEFQRAAAKLVSAQGQSEFLDNL